MIDQKVAYISRVLFDSYEDDCRCIERFQHDVERLKTRISQGENTQANIDKLDELEQKTSAMNKRLNSYENMMKSLRREGYTHFQFK